MAASQGMIEPFEPGQIKVRNSNGLVLTALSYGYDIRFSDELPVY